jgi:2-polyprenyl-3-methyl-5-hydroxy-6-metoxy-1,4-benzoquinol methylase
MKEEEIRPKAIFDEYLRLAAADTVTYFGTAVRIPIACPACGTAGETAFTKSGFTYDLCPTCRTLYVSPRPAAEAFANYYTESPSAKYWASTFYKQTADARRKHIWRPKASAIEAIIKQHAPRETGCTVVDIGGGYGLFAEEMSKLSDHQLVVIEPSPDLAAACREKSLKVVQKFLEEMSTTDLPDGGKTFVSFELFEHLHSPEKFLQALMGLMSPGDLFVFTTLSGTGVDIQALWEDSKSISPPHHLNFLNPSSVRLLLTRLGLEVLEVSTPGKLDIDILENNWINIKDRFWMNFVAMASEDEKRQWQTIVSETGWSSHMMVVTRKP